MSDYRAIIVDDEESARNILSNLLKSYCPEVEVVDMCVDVQEAVIAIKKKRPNLVFLDIEMPNYSGYEIVNFFDKIDFEIIFITAYDEYAIQAFDEHAFDYLLKPITEKRLLKTCERIRSYLFSVRTEQNRTDPNSVEAIERLVAKIQSPAISYLRWIKASKGDDICLVPVDDVNYLQAEDKYVSVYTRYGEYLIRTPLKELIKQLDPDLFWQIHRATIVRVDAIERVKRDFTGKMHVHLSTGGVKLAVSRNAQGLFKQM